MPDISLFQPFPSAADSAAPRRHFTRREMEARYEQAAQMPKLRPGQHGPGIGAPGRSILRALVFDFFDYRTGQCNPSYEALQENTSLAETTIRRALKHLESLGLIYVAPTARCGGRVQLRSKETTHA